MNDSEAAFEAQVEWLAANLGRPKEGVVRDLLVLRDYRCWKRIQRCFNGWGIGICALPNRHGGDCSPFPRKEVR